MKRLPIYISVLFALFSCTQDALLRHYAMRRLAEGPIEYEMDSIRRFLDSAVVKCENVTWLSEYPLDDYARYVISPQIKDEPVDYYWMWHIPTWIKPDDHQKGVAEVAQGINKKIRFKIYPENYGDDILSYTEIMERRIGKCDDRAVLTVMALRAYGIPAAFDMIPFWGSNNNGHSFASAIMPDCSPLVFQSENDNGYNPVFANKVTKIYRASNGEWQDVTASHSIGCRDVEIPLNGEKCDEEISLAVFSTSGWQKVMSVNVSRETVVFKDVGTGSLYDGSNPVKGENIGNGIVYLPCSYIEGDIIPASHPMVVSDTSLTVIQPNDTKRIPVCLKRKYPLLDRIIRYADQMIDGVFEVSNDPDFKESKTIYEINRTPYSGLQFINVKADAKYRYIRYCKQDGIFNLAELMLYDDDGNKLEGNVISIPLLKNLNDTGNIADGDLLTNLTIPYGKNLWVGLDLGKPRDISKIGFAPRNDDNNINLGEMYELFYWDNQWISCGIKVADKYNELTFYDVPEGALLWLRNFTKGREERPFIYVDGKQIWY